jgi:type I restriction enzyme M protein
LQLKANNQEYRSLKLYGQEINLITSAIARMNMFMHGIEEFQIVRGDTLSEPGLLENDALKKFNVILANPPYSIKAWDRKAFESDPYGRNIWGTPPQGCADYAFQQHIQKSLDPQNGRSISLWPHGILFRDSEAEMRRLMVESDVVECVVSLGPNLFYNSSMVSCLLITNNNKAYNRKGKVLFIEAVDEVRKEKTMSYLDEKHIQRIHNAYTNFKEEDGFSKIVSIEDIVIDKNARLSVQLYVNSSNEIIYDFDIALSSWEKSSDDLRKTMGELFNVLG